MKRLLGIATIAMIIMIAATPVYAGFWGSVKASITTNAIDLAVGALIGALGMLGVTYKMWGKASKELFDFARAAYAAWVDDNKIDDDEMIKILKEGREFGEAAKKAYAVTWGNQKEE